MAATTSAPSVTCVNHPQTETLLRCNKCGKPVCMKCVERTVVGYRCKECLHGQREGYYNATSIDYVAAAIIGTVLSIVGGAIMGLVGGFWLFGIFAGPIGGGVIAESIRAVIRRRRGRYIWLLACAAIVVGGVLGIIGLPFVGVLLSGRLLLLAGLVPRALFNLGFLIYLALAVSTAYARLRA